MLKNSPGANKKRKKTLRKIILGGLFFSLLSGILIYGAIFSPFFKIKNITVSGTKEISPDLIKKDIEEGLGQFKFKIIPQNSFFTFFSKTLNGRLLNNFKEIESLTVRKDFLKQTLEIRVQEKTKEAILCFLSEVDSCFFIDKEGGLLKESPMIKGGSLVVIELKKEDQNNIDSALIGFINKFKKIVEENTNLAIFSAKIKNNQEIILETAAGWQIYLNKKEPPEKQAQIVKRILEEEIKEKQNNLDYIDLRIEGRVYYKYK